MKNLILILLFSSILMVSAEAQNPQYPYGLSFKALFMDYQSQNGGSITDFSSYHRGFEIGIHKNLNQNLNLVVPIKVGVVNSHDSDFENCLHKNVYGGDVQLQYQFYKPQTKVTPYVVAGLGGVLEDVGDFNVQIPFGAGLYFHVRDNAYINWQSEYRYSLSDDRNNLHHGLGFVYLFGEPMDMDKLTDMEDDMNKNVSDSDGDGLEDEIDLCPQVAGPIALKGCPDRDEDGVPDYRDDCPSIAGIAIFKGCPDTDGDGISDNDDECPKRAGTKEKNGCPDDMGAMDKMNQPKAEPIVEEPVMMDKDSDGDGVMDKNDRCPNIKGDIANGGCPKVSQPAVADRDGDGVPDASDRCPDSPGIQIFGGCPDTDGDGIDDSRDKCPNSAGTVASGGCPEIAAADRTALELAMRAVTFNTGKSTLTRESFSVLDQIAQIMNRYPDYNLIIEGHTDNVGSAVNNQLLSEKRAKACYDYLRDQGYVPASRMAHSGYGESRPISSNDNLSGRTLNRRVVFNLIPRG